MTKIIKSLQFQGQTLETIQKDSQIWVTSKSLAQALNYSQEDAITKIYNRNKDEFTSKMSQQVNLGVSGNLQKQVRIFSLRGCHLIAMLSRTDIAKEFRKWVLDILDKETPLPQHPSPLNPHIKSLTLKFYNKIIYIAKLPNTGEVLFNVSSLCDAIGVDVNCKRGKLNKDDIIKNSIYRLKAKLNQTAIFIPIKYLNYFLDTIYISPNHKNYKKIIHNINLYSNECYNFIINQLSVIEEEKRRKLLLSPSSLSQENLQYRELQETTQQIKHTQQQTKEVNQNKDLDINNNKYINQNKNNQQKEQELKQEIQYQNKLQAINLLKQYTSNSKVIQTILLRYPNYDYIIKNISYLYDNIKTLHPNIKTINLRLIRVALKDNYAKIDINDNNNSTHINTNLLLKNESTNQKQEQEEKQTQDTDINKYIINYLTSKNYYNNLNNFNSNQEEKTTEQKREFIIQALSFFISIDEIEELFDCCSYNYNYLYNNIHTVMNMYKHRIIK